MRKTVLQFGLRAGLILFGLLCTLPTPSVSAQANKGLTISPIRQYLKVTAGQTVHGSFIIANFTAAPMPVQFSVEEFSVSDYVYDYRFAAPKSDWIKLGLTEVTLAPNERKTIDFQINTPPNSPPGGQYYTIFATGTPQSNNGSEKVQVATLLYLTVQGKLVQTTSLQGSHAPRIVLGRSTSVQLDIRNTGNVHFFAQTSTAINGLLAKNNSNTSSSLLLPGTVRRIETAVPMPLLPGIYRLNYGYRTDTEGVHNYSRTILYIPYWTLLIIAGIALVVIRRRRQKRPHDHQDILHEH